MSQKYIHLSPRLACALSMLEGFETVADIGCDHGRLTAALLQQNNCRHVIASDISEPSLKKAEELIRYIGLSDRVSVRCGNGLTVLKPNECDAIAILGMGGTLMAQLLSSASEPLKGVKCIVLQPMRAQADIRKYLYENAYWITDDRVIEEHGRFYQLFRAIPNTKRQPWPSRFPAGFFDVGYQSYIQEDRNLIRLCQAQLQQHMQQLKRAFGTDGEQKLTERIAALNQIINAITEKDI